MWEAFEARLDENERERPAPLRGTLFDVIRSSGLRPGAGVTKKMLAFEFGEGERLLWEISGSAQNFYLIPQWRPILERKSFGCELKTYQTEKGNRGGRHSALNNSWAFGKDDCILVRVDRSEEHTSELQSLMRISYAVFCLKKKRKQQYITR